MWAGHPSLPPGGQKKEKGTKRERSNKGGRGAPNVRAIMSTQLPRLDDECSVSSMSALATVMAFGDRAGVRSHESPPVLPALTTGITPSAASRSMAASWWVPDPLSDACKTVGMAGLAALAAATASHPAATSDLLPLPLALSTRMHARVTPGATPVRRPPIVPATWEP